MNKFKPNQKIVCVVKGQWNWAPDARITSFWLLAWVKLMKRFRTYGPKFNEIVTVESINMPGRVILSEYKPKLPNGGIGEYMEEYFEPLVESEVLRNELADIFESNHE